MKFFQDLVKWSRIRLTHGVLLAAIWLVVVCGAALLAPLITPYNPNSQNLLATNLGPSWQHLLGTDNLGRDTLSRAIFAARVALPAAAIGTFVAVALGLAVGVSAGYIGGLWDRISMRAVDAVLALPGLIVAIAVVGAVGPSLLHAMVTLGLLASVAYARLARGVVMSVRHRDYIDAARVTGETASHVLLREVMPNVLGPLVVQATLTFAHMLLAEAALSFIGLGVQAPQASWGSMLNSARSQIDNDPFLALPPGLALFLTVLSVQTLGDGLRNAAGTAGRSKPRPLGNLNVLASAVRSNGTEQPAEEATGRILPSEPALVVDSLCVSVVGTADRSAAPEETQIVEDLSLVLAKGEALGLVGESGSGKSMTALALIGLLPPGIRVIAGSIHLGSHDLLRMSDTSMNAIRGDRIAMIFQNPARSLDPVRNIGSQIAEPLRIHRQLSRSQAKRQAVELLGRVGVQRPSKRVNDYPHQLSGGQMQRVMIAAALACSPDLLIADEPTTALDTTVQRRILDLLRELQSQEAMAMLFISHDLAVVSDICDRIAVMRAGRIVEQGPAGDLTDRPRHPYTRALLATEMSLDTPDVTLSDPLQTSTSLRQL